MTLRAVSALGNHKAMDFSPGQVGVTPKGFGLAFCGTGHSHHTWNLQVPEDLGIFSGLRSTWCPWRGCGCSEPAVPEHQGAVLERCPAPVAAPSRLHGHRTQLLVAPPGWREGWAVPVLPNLTRALVGSRPSLREWSWPEQGKAPGAESCRCLFPAVLVDLAMARGWIPPEAEQSLWHCPWNHPEHPGQGCAYLRAAQTSVGEASGRAACSIKRAPVGGRRCQHSQAPARTARGSGKDGGYFPQCLMAELLQHEEWGLSFRAPPLTQV